jgi:hypothetical protein
MSRESPYHTRSTEYLPQHREVYHDKDACTSEKKIKHQHRAC